MSAENNYTGSLSFNADTNLPRVSLQGRTDKFKTLDIVLKNKHLSVDAVVDMDTILSSVYFSNYQVYKNNFPSRPKETPALLKMNIHEASCSTVKTGFECVGAAEFYLAKAGFAKIIKIMIDKDNNVSSTFVLSQKELNLKPHHFAGVEIDDKVKVYLFAKHK